MDKGIYTALSGGIAKSHELELVANNLANATTPGFKRDTGTFNEYLTELRRNEAPEMSPAVSEWQEGGITGDKSFVEMDGVYTDFRQGDIRQTGRSLDVAIEGDGFFEVLTPAGIRYTRQGNFNVTPDGRMVTTQGFPLLAKGAAQPESRVVRVGQGNLSITSEGNLVQNGATLSSLSVQEFHEDQWLEKVGQSYFRNTNDANLRPSSGKIRLHQGAIEGSNVNPVHEMTKLIEVTRAYESHMQAVKTYQEIDGKSVNEIIRER